MPRGGGDHFDRDEQQERSNAEAAGERASKRGEEVEQAPPSSSTSSTSTSPVISARRPLGARPLLMTPPPPVATLFRALASAGAILVDDDLRSRAANALRAGVQQAPRRAREVVQRAQQNAAAARLARGLAAEREAKVDVQVGPELYEDDEQELRSRMWVAILEDDSLFGSVAPPAEGEEEESVSEGGGESKGESEDDDEHEAAPGSASEAEEEEGAEQQFLRRAEAEAKEEEEKGPSASAPSPRSASAAAPALPVDQTATAAAAEAAAEAAADPWEMVQGSSNLYPASSESKLRKENGKREIANESKKTAAATATAAETTKKRSKTSSKKKTKKPKKPKSLSARVLDAVDSVPWPLSTEYPENGRYNHLVSAPFPPGDDTDDAVGRDIGRTFPEHPQFGYAHGRAALARVLRAAALEDPRVGYCQGMAFVAGVLLMFLPEELSFRVLTERLLREQQVIDVVVVGDVEEKEREKKKGGEEEERSEGGKGTTEEKPAPPPPPRVGGAGGAGLRTLYEPGLSGLKSLLAQYEWLLERLAPEVSARLSNLGIPPVLYAAQWILTAFACPFPPHVAARVLDAVLLERSPAPLLRASLAVAVALGPALLAAPADFEAALKVLKLQPPAWSAEEVRAVLSSGLCGDLVPRGAVEAAAAAVGAKAEAEARREEEGRAREREAEREEQEKQQKKGRAEVEKRKDEEEEDEKVEEGGEGEKVPSAAVVSSSSSLSRPSASALLDSSIASLELAFEGLAWSGAAAAAETAEATEEEAEAEADAAATTTAGEVEEAAVPSDKQGTGGGE